MNGRKVLPNEEGREPVPDAPGVETPDWDEIAAGEISGVVEEDIDLDAPPPEELPEEDDDNPYQESDEALPDDDEEREIRRDERDSGMFDGE
ncbi:hypothetical protein [Limoniibacter endophyticus]|uniref:Uncharacterized protein n=1 Tax=Limoniibacter endophyticus TaxID=1565040 RepID=A0A8J3GJE4_9HYPH|nr:hypothetical protein [Limoniibacter endophyticus]GHC77700.1 hypothetical protein GCM10010136_29100 [Limoniibacter endophyticus]